jgi:hypothetical protein
VVKQQQASMLTITMGAVAADGGSISLQAVDQQGATISFYLQWSIMSQQDGTAQFYVNSKAIPKGSKEEATWLSLVRSAKVQEPARDLALLAGSLVSTISSAAYQDHACQAEPPTLWQRIQSLFTHRKT